MLGDLKHSDMRDKLLVKGDNKINFCYAWDPELISVKKKLSTRGNLEIFV